MGISIRPQQPAYTGEQVYYGQTIFEASPLNRVGPEAFLLATAGRGVASAPPQQYLTNSAPDSVLIWNITNDTLTYQDNDTGRPISRPARVTTRLANSIRTSRSMNKVTHLSNTKTWMARSSSKRFRLALFLLTISGYSGWLATHIISTMNSISCGLFYRLKQSWLHILTVGTFSADTNTLNELCFRFEYDYRQRNIATKVPGAGWTLYGL